MKYLYSSPEPSTEPPDHTKLLPVVERGIQNAAHVYARTSDQEVRAWLDEWLIDAKAAVAQVVGDGA